MGLWGNVSTLKTASNCTMGCSAGLIPIGEEFLASIWDRYQFSIMRNLGSYCFVEVILVFSRLLFKNLKIEICKTIMPVMLYGCETWSLTLREECKLRVFENRIGPKRDKNGEWRRLREELPSL